MKLGAPATGDDFRGRQQELKDLWRHIESDHLKLPGAKRLGKTSILKRMVEQATERGVYARWIDVSAIESPAALLEKLEAEFPATGLKAFISKHTNKASTWLRRVEKVDLQAPEALGGGGASVHLNAGTTPGWSTDAATLQQRLQHQPLLIMLDEFPVMLQDMLVQDWAEAQQLLKVMRIWRQTGHWRFVFTGSIGLSSLLERHGLGVHMNDCFDFPLGPMRPKEALGMWLHFSRKAGWGCDDTVGQHAMARIGWLSPFYLNLLLDGSLKVATERVEETSATEQTLQLADVDAAYENLLAARARFHHWEKRLRDSLSEPELGFCLSLLDHVAKKDEGLSLAQLSQRLAKRVPDVDARKRLLQDLLTLLHDEGYLSPPDADGKVRFLSFLLRDWWQRNH
jgi:uncharacterized protein